MSDYTPFDAQEWLEAGPQIVKRGGPGSGHFGHEGRPGQRGGSAPGDGGTTVSEAKASGANRLRQLAQARDKSRTRELSSVTLEEEYWGLRDRMGDWLEKQGIPFERDDPFDIATKYQKNYKPDELETTVSELKVGGHPRGEAETTVGITSQKEGLVPGWQVQAEMEDFRTRLNAIEGVSEVRAYVGRGAWKGGSEETWVVRFNGNGEAKRLIAETGARYGQDAVLIMEPPTPENTHPITELSFERNLTRAEREGINQRMADLGFGGWTWGVARTERMPLLRVASVPDFGSDDAQHAGQMQALGTELSALGLNPRRDDFQVAVTTAGPGGRVAYDEFINSLTLYKERHHGVNAAVGRAHSPAVGAGERAGQGRAGDLAGRTAGTAGASDEGGRGAGHFHSQGVVTPVLRRFVARGGPGSGHHGHEGRPGQRGGSAPGDGSTTISEGRQEGPVASDDAVDFERRLLERFGDAEPLAGTWIGPSGKYLVHYGDHQDTAMWLLGRNLESISSHEKRIEAGLVATNDVVRAGLVRYNIATDFVYFDIPSRAQTTREQRDAMALVVEKTAEQQGRWPFAVITLGPPFTNLPDDAKWEEELPITTERAYAFLGIEDYEPYTPFVPAVERGGPGSGHFGHAGRPGVRGGSLPGEGGMTIDEAKRRGEYAKVYADRKQSFQARYDKLIADRNVYMAHQSPSDGPTTTMEADLAANAAKGPPWNGNIRKMSSDLRRFADQTIRWMNGLRETGGFKTEKRALEILKMDLGAFANQPDKLMERVSIFLALDLPYIMHGEPGYNVPAMVQQDGTVNADHPVLQAMAQAGGVKGEAIINVLQVARSSADAMRLIDTAAMEARAGTGGMDNYYAQAPAVREEVSPIRNEVMAQAAAAEQRVRDIEARLPELEAAYFGMTRVINAPDADKTMSQEDWFRTAEGADEALEAYHHAQLELIEAKRDANDDARGVLDDALMVKGERAPLSVDTENATVFNWNQQERDWQRGFSEGAVKWLAANADPSTIDPNFATVKLHNSDGYEGRGGWNKGGNSFSARSGWTTKEYVHELGHYFEDRNPGVHEAAVAFLRDRTTGQVDRHLEELNVGMGFDDDETSRPDAFVDSYVGKVYQDYYATEVVSMGFQLLYKDPAGFARSDPEHFDLVVGMLKGLWNKSS